MTGDFSAVFEQVDRYASDLISTGRYPGLAVALTDRRCLLWANAYGYANLDAKTQLQADVLFEIGSIGKSFTSIALLQLNEKGLLDLHAPLNQYLPWFEIQTRYAPITLHHLLSHTAGIVRGVDFSPESFAEVWTLRDTETGSAPGEHFLYSNTGYKALGLVLEAVSGKSYAEAIQEAVLSPLEMTASTSSITHDTRRRMAVGYGGFYDDRPHHPEYGFAPATWFETATGDGCIASNVADMAKYLRLFLNYGAGEKARVLQADSFDLMTRGVAEREQGLSYGYGIARIEKEGRLYLGHSGGMVGYLSNIRMDMTAGFGVVLLVNGPEIPLELCDYTLKLLSQAQDGQPLEAVPPVKDPGFIPQAVELAGTYRKGDEALRLVAVGDRLSIHLGSVEAPLETAEEGDFFVMHPDFRRFLLHVEREEGMPVSIGFGSEEYLREGVPTPLIPDFPPEWESYLGHYRCYNPWFSNFRIIRRRGGLVLIHPRGSEQILVPLKKGVFRIGKEEYLPERIRFRTIENGKVQIASISSLDFFRSFTS